MAEIRGNATYFCVTWPTVDFFVQYSFIFGVFKTKLSFLTFLAQLPLHFCSTDEGLGLQSQRGLSDRPGTGTAVPERVEGPAWD